MQPKLTLVTDRGAHSYWPGEKKPVAADVMILPSPSPTEAAWGSVMSESVQTGQLSPVSVGIGLPVEGCSTPATAPSNPPSSANPWDSEMVDDMDQESPCHYLERCVGTASVLPKLEPVDDDINLDLVKLAPSTPPLLRSPISAEPSAKQKRTRGRPRKMSLTSPVASSTKATNGRSKTGCITCRKRKKKCDEAKPRCMNCEKNAVMCEGYHEKQLWKSGRERAEGDRRKGERLPTVTMPPLIYGIETSEDRVLWRHYVSHFSNVLTVEGEANNAFKDVILQLANQHQGLMHSLLALSSKHIDLGSPYGVRMLQSHPGTSRESLQRRAEFHHAEALKRLYEDLEKSLGKDDPEYQTMLAGRYGQILCLLLQTRTDGNPRGEHRLHLQAYQSLIQQSPPGDAAFNTFVTEFFQYHVYADDLFWHPAMMTRRLSTESWQPSAPIEAPRLLGVADGLFTQLAQITSIRNAIREKMAASADPVVDHAILSRAVDIDAAIREWSPRWPPGDSRNRVAPLYRQVMWVYLFRTIYPPWRRVTEPSPSPQPSEGPPRRRDSAVVARRGDAAEPGNPSPGACTTTWKPWRPGSTQTSDSRSAEARHPVLEDGRMTLAVDESLSILESFRPSDPIQTLLLVPCLLIGTACFQPAQRDRIRSAVRLVRGYTGLRSCDRATELLEELWSLMDEADWLSVWDWQGVARRMELDFLCA
ncbi:hypothetical protein XA68_13059 [Ophiocordyceps unilateralis]|uniref:Zn(2)-C6 fungal-type domain-containing protein n=1 Tax=Ophiocordyceps unilateralis TaxID=268505 RepID=A0A2A9PDG0_OPHUN|nr:hypothetical protein XA68_13059 [Ophiocordyceps unilateralis]